MNFTNDRDVAERFREGAVPSTERLMYFCIMMVLMSACGTANATLFVLQTDDGGLRTLNEWDTYIDVVLVSSTLFGTLYCYIQNKRGDDREFIEPYICIGFPVAVQTMFLTLLMYIVLGIFSTGTADVTTEWDLGIYLVIVTFFFARLGNSIKIAAT